jgi:hypothetical protein
MWRFNLSRSNDNKHKRGPGSVLVTLLLVAFTSLFSVGCGSSDNGFVATTGGNTATTGDLVFQFTKAQAINVPVATTDLDFEFFDTSNNSVFFYTQAFANTVTVQNVPITATRVVITARGPGGVPLATIDAPVAVVAGGTALIDLSGALVTLVTLDSLTALPNPVALSLDGGPTTAQLALSGNFSNGDIVALGAAAGGAATYTDFDALVATVDANGLVTAVGGGATSVDIGYTLNGATVNLLDHPITVAGPAGTLIVEPAALQFAPGGVVGALEDIIVSLLSGGDETINNIAFFRVFFIPAGQTQRIEVTSRVGVSFSNFFPGTVTADSFAHLNLFGEGIGITSNPFGPTPPFGATATMTITYIENGQAFTANVDITLDNPTLQTVEVGNAPDGTMTLPATGVTNFPVVAYAIYSNGLRLPIDLAGGTILGSPSGYPDTFAMSIQTPATGLGLTNGNSTIDTTGGGVNQTGVVGITANGEATPRTTFNVPLFGGQITEVALSIPRTDINPSGSYYVIATFDDNTTTLDLTGVWPSISESGPGDVSFTGLFDFIPSGRILGTDVGPTNVRIDGGAGTGATTATLVGLGLTGASDASDANNDQDVDVLSRVPVALFP